MQRSLGMLVAIAIALASGSAACAQSLDPTRSESSTPLSSQPAPILRVNPNSYPPFRLPLFDPQPATGVSIRSDGEKGVETVTASGEKTELRISRGRADVTLHHPKDRSEIVVDLPGGRVSLLKDGLYTFNAEKSTVRVLRGEAEAFSGTPNEGKGAKVKEGQELTLEKTGRLKAVEAYSYELTADLLSDEGPRGDRAPFSEGVPYGDGFYAGSYYPVEYPYPWGGYYPIGYGYPIGLSFGFGSYYGFHAPGFRR